MFKKVTRFLTNEIGSGDDLQPVRRVSCQERFQPLCVVERKKAMFHLAPCYRDTEHMLEDLLLPAAGEQKSTGSVLRVEELSDFTITKEVTDRIDGKLDIHIDSASGETKGAASSSRVWEAKVHKKRVSASELKALARERRINVNHPFIQKLCRTGQNLYVVHEAFETSETATYKELSEGEGSFLFSLYGKFCIKGSRESKASVTIPKGYTVAFRVTQLDITKAAWEPDNFRRLRLGAFVSDSPTRGKLEALKAEVKKNCKILTKLPPDLSVALLKAIKAVMTDSNLFQELAQKMNAVLDEDGSCKMETESPDLQGLLSSLQCSEDHLFELAQAITYTLDALEELTEDQLLLLLESLEEKIVPQQLKLVESILEHDFELINGPFRVDTSLLCFSREEEQELTMAMVEMSGVKLQKDGSAVCAEEAFSDTAALYVSLYVLNLLSNSD